MFLIDLNDDFIYLIQLTRAGTDNLRYDSIAVLNSFIRRGYLVIIHRFLQCRQRRLFCNDIQISLNIVPFLLNIISQRSIHTDI